MKRIVLVVGALVLAGGLGLGLWLGRRSASTGAGGRSTDAWLEQLRSLDAEEGARAARELAGLGKPGLDVLLQARQDSDIRAHRRAAAALAGLPDAAGPLVEALPRGGPRIEVVLVRLGEAALPALERALQDGELAEPAAGVLSGMGPRARPAVPALAALLQDQNAKEEARAAAARALGRIGPEDPAGQPEQLAIDPVIGALTSVLSGPARVRIAAAGALADWGPAARSAIPALVRHSRDGDVAVARAACRALERTRSRAAAPALLARLEHADRASPAAAAGLARLGPEARAAVGGLIASLAGKKADAALAQAVLERLGAVAVPDLVDALKEPARCRFAAEVLGLMGPRAAAAVAALESLLGDRDPAVVLAAAGALVRIDPARATVVVPAVVPLVLRPQEDLATAAALLLAGLGPDAARAAPVLVTALQAKDGRVVARAAHVLGRIRPAQPGVIEALKKGLSGPQKGRPACARALGRMGRAAKPASGALIALLDQRRQQPTSTLPLFEQDLWAETALALLRIDPDHSERAISELTTDLESGHDLARGPALAALARLRPLPPALLSALRPLLGDRQTAGRALIVLARLDGKQLRPLVPDLITLLSSTDAGRRDGAIGVLARVGPDALPAVEAALRSGSPLARAAAARAWAEVQVGAPPREPAPLLPLLGDAAAEVRQAAAEAIADAGGRAEDTRRAMRALLARPEAELRRPAARLARSWPDGPGEWTPDLLECLFDPDAEVRRQAVLALRPDDLTMPALRGALDDPAPGVRLAVARTLKTRDVQTTAVLVDLARRAEPGGRAVVLRLLGEVDRERARALLDELEADLRAEDIDARIDSAVALVEIDAGRAAVVLPLLLGILEGWDEPARLRAARALEALGAHARPALPALRRRIERDDSPAVRRACEAAVRAITAKERRP
jgi:HEAT repeat protein